MYEKRRARKEKRIKRIRTAVMLLAAFLVAGGITAAGAMMIRKMAEPERTRPEETLYAYADCLNRGDYAGIYPLLNAESKAAVTEEELLTRYQNIYDGIEAANISLTIDTVLPEDAGEWDISRPAALDYHISMDTLAGKLTFPSSTLLTYDEEANTWKMIWKLSEIFPGLEEGLRVRVRTIQAERGQIYDAQQNLIAGEGAVWSAGVVPGKLQEPREEAIKEVAAAMGVSEEKVEAALSASWVKDDLFVPIRSFSKEDTDLKEQLLKVPGIMLSTVEDRVYPYGEAAGHLSGYVQSITAEELEARRGLHYNSLSVLGKTGVEAALESTLRSQDGYRIVLVNEEGEEVEEVLSCEAQNGQDVRLTINAPLQQKIYEVMGGDKGAAAAINPVTGEVLAYVSTPAYDPNDFVLGYTAADWEAVNADERQPFYNRAKSTYCPGSVMKPIVGALALEAGILEKEDTISYNGNAWQLDASWGDYMVTTLHSDYSPKNLRNALVYSDNVFFAKTAVMLGADSFEEGLLGLGFQETPDFLLAMTASSYGGEEALENSMVLADSGYGHGQLMVNPLHLACIYSAFYNEGSMIAPTLSYGEEPVWWKENAMSRETADFIRSCLVDVVNTPEGTGRAAALSDKLIAGKTGTAELKQSKDDTTGTEIGWFVGMNGEEDANPIIIVMVIEDVKERGGSAYVAGKVAECLKYYYLYKE